MEWNLYWIILGGLAFLFALIHLIRAIWGKTKGNAVLMLLSLSFGAFTVLEEYRMLCLWMDLGETGFVRDALAHIPNVLTAALWLGIGINALAIWVGAKKNAGK